MALTKAKSKQISHLGSATGAVARTLYDKLNESVSVKDFGAVGDGVTDDTAAIQAAITYAFSVGKDVIGDGSTYAISRTLLIPQNSPSPTFTKARKITLDFKNSIFKMLSDTTLFSSAYSNSGTLTSNYGTTLDAYYSNAIKLTNFGVESNVGQLTTPTLKIQDWHQQCEISNITSSVSQQMLWANNCYYTSFDNINAGIIAPKAGDRFIWFNATNLCKISRLVAANAITGYRFDGPVTGLQMTNMSFEGQTKGVVFNSTVYDAVIENSYMESISDTVISTATYVNGLTIRNNYVNFMSSSTTYLLSYYPGPSNNIHITDDNNFQGMLSVANIIKNREDVYGAGITIDRFPTNVPDTSYLQVDPTLIGFNVKWNQKAYGPYMNAAVVNRYAVGNYSGQYTNGLYGGTSGFDWINTGNNTLVLRTKITKNFVQIVYVGIAVLHSAGPTTIRGQFVGDSFYEYTASGLVLSTKLTSATYGGYLEIDGGIFFNTTVTGCVGEVRLI